MASSGIRQEFEKQSAVRRPQLRMFAVALALLTPVAAQPQEKVWFAPDNDTEDFMAMFQQPDLWASSRLSIQVFKFGPQQVKTARQPPVNSFDELVKANAFAKLRAWKIDVAIEAPAIKPWDCTAVKARENTVGYIRNVMNANGIVRYIAMDEPLASGLEKCGQQVDEIADKTASYIQELSSDPSLQTSGSSPEVGDIEGYPRRSVADIERWVRALESRGAKPKFFHLDANVHRLDVDSKIDEKRDLLELKRFFQVEGIPLGIILWPGYNPVNSDKNYYDRTIAWTKRVHKAIGRPDQIIFQSWVLRGGLNTCANTDPQCNMNNPMCTPSDPPGCGKHGVPLNLPDNNIDIFSHTRLVIDGLRVLNSH